MRNKIKGTLTDRLNALRGKTIATATSVTASSLHREIYLQFTDGSTVNLPYTFRDDFVADDFEINDTRFDYGGTPIPFIVPKGLLQPWRYYVVSVKFRANNPAHKAIMATQGHKNMEGQWVLSERFELFCASYETNDQTYSFYDIYWFRVESELTSLYEKVGL